MAKRRFRSTPTDESPESLSPEERRQRRKAERTREGRAKKPHDDRRGWRRAVVPAGIVAGVAAVILFFLYVSGTILQPPCIQFTAIPSQSGSPAFPTSNTTDFSQTWCPNAAFVYQTYPLVTINVNGGNVPLPPSIGRSTNFTNYECDLPIATHPSAPGYAPGIVYIQSAWPYEYRLSDLFTVWQGSYVSAYVNASYSTRSIDYSPTQFLGLPVDARHSVTVFVDNQVNSAGASLLLSTLDNSPGPTPGCLGTIYGTGHTISVVYRATGVGAAVPGQFGSVAGPTAGVPLPGTFDHPSPGEVTPAEAYLVLGGLPASPTSLLLLRGAS